MFVNALGFNGNKITNTNITVYKEISCTDFVNNAVKFYSYHFCININIVQEITENISNYTYICEPYESSPDRPVSIFRQILTIFGFEKDNDATSIMNTYRHLSKYDNNDILYSAYFSNSDLEKINQIYTLCNPINLPIIISQEDSLPGPPIPIIIF